MKNVSSNTIKYFLFFLVLCTVSIPSIISLCRIFPDLSFDNQALLLWKYSASIGVEPYKEIFYPYGFLAYYAGQDVFFSLIYYLVSPVTLLIILSVLQKVFLNKYYLILSSIFFYMFIFFVTGFDTFARYGPLVAAIMALSLILNIKNSKRRIIIICIYGLIIGLVFALINDVGLYVPIVFSIMAIVFTFMQGFTKRIDAVKKILSELLVFYFGYILGLIPFGFYLVYNNMLEGVIGSLMILKEVTLFAKTPFFHSISSPSNIFIITIMLITMTTLLLSIYLQKQKVTKNKYMQIGLVILLLLLEQKNVIRSIDSQITFIGFLLFASLFYDFIGVMSKNNINNKAQLFYFINLSIVIIFLIGLLPLQSNQKISDMHIQLYSSIHSLLNKSCIADNLSSNVSSNAKRFEVIKYLKQLPNFNGKVFSFPGEPVFYIILQQKPPFFPSIYEATPLASQQKLIAYIEDEDIEYVVYNTTIQSIQDEVPDVVRGRLLYGYIRKNFTPVDNIQGYLILKRNYSKKNYVLDTSN